MPELKGSIIATGANGGLGSGFVSNLINSPYGSDYRAIYTVRNPSTSTSLKAALAKAPSSHTSETIALDLGNFESIRDVAAKINARVAERTLEPIRALVLNAGWQEANSETMKPQTYTVDGFEGHFAINYLGNFLFVLLLLQSMDKERGRIVIVSSFAHDPYDSRNDMLGCFKDEKYKTVYTNTETLSKGVVYNDDPYLAGMRRYGASKLLMVLFMYELQRRLNSDPSLSNISALSVDPGAIGGTNINTKAPLFVRVLSFLAYFFQPIVVYFFPNGLMRTAKKSGADLLLACFDEKHLGEHPKAVFLNGSERADSSAESRNEKKQKMLWMDSVKLARIRAGDTVLKNWQ